MKQKFTSWVHNQGSITRLAAKLGVETMTVRAWLEGRTSPRVLTMQKLVEMGGGAFSYDDVINESKKQKRGNP